MAASAPIAGCRLSAATAGWIARPPGSSASIAAPVVWGNAR
jgi:hypothetical protein